MADYRQFFQPGLGLKAKTAAQRVMRDVPLRFGPDNRFWGYRDGVWTDAQVEVHRAVVQLLDEAYRPAHRNAITEVLRGLVPDLEIKPLMRAINMRNGMVMWDVKTGEISRQRHHDMYESTIQLPVEWVEDAQCPEWDAFLAQSVNPDDVKRVWQIIGYLMMSGNPLQRMFLLTGGGGNGKGVFLHVIRALLGPSNVSHVPLHAFMDDRWAPGLLFNRLANICGDIDTSFIERTGQIKELSGEDTITGERKNEPHFTFQFWGKAIFSANGIPASADATVGWSRRWEVVGFPNAPLRPDRTLKDRLAAPDSLRGIAVKAVSALVDLLQAGEFDHGASAMRAHQEFRERSNSVLRWLSEDFYADPSAWYERKALLTAFRRWADHDAPGGRAMGKQTFYERIRAVPAMREAKRNGIWGFVGYRLRAEIAYGEVIGEDTDSDEELPSNAPEQTAPDPLPGL